jgi:hypothetical protein
VHVERNGREAYALLVYSLIRQPSLLMEVQAKDQPRVAGDQSRD